MTPTLAGRIQTRLAMLGTVGVLWTIIIGMFVPRPAGATSGDIYQALFTALLIVAVVGIAWEVLYHALQQYRWEKDWPTILGLVVALPEGILAWMLLKAGIPWDVGPVQASTFLTMFITLWIIVWAITNGPLQIFFLRWRYRGGRFTGGW